MGPIDGAHPALTDHLKQPVTAKHHLIHPAASLTSRPLWAKLRMSLAGVCAVKAKFSASGPTV
jgi:hypothetical protein